MTAPSKAQPELTQTDAPASVLQPMMEAGQEISGRIAGLDDEMRDMILGMTKNNAAIFAEALAAIASAKTPLEGAKVYSDFLMSFIARASKQFMDVTQAISRSNSPS
jgi:hypothetical protein